MSKKKKSSYEFQLRIDKSGKFMELNQVTISNLWIPYDKSSE